MNVHSLSKPVMAGLTLVTIGWAIFLASMMQIVAHPLQPRSLTLLLLELGCSLVSLRLTNSSLKQSGTTARLTPMLSVTLFGTALLPFWTGLAFLHMH